MAVLDANTPEGAWQIIQPRERDLEYGCSHYGDHFYITTNREAKNFKLVRTPVNATTYDNWEDVLPHRDDVLLEGIDIFQDYLVVSERSNGLNQIRVKRWDDAEDYYIEFPDPAYSAYVGANPDFDTQRLRYGYTSMTTPSTVFETDMATKDTETLKQAEVLGGEFDPANYQSERVMVGHGTARWCLSRLSTARAWRRMATTPSCYTHTAATATAWTLASPAPA